jgi:hypothetical protein
MPGLDFVHEKGLLHQTSTSQEIPYPGLNLIHQQWLNTHLRACFTSGGTKIEDRDSSMQMRSFVGRTS